MSYTLIPTMLHQTYPSIGPSRHQEWISKQQVRNKSLELTSLPAGMLEFANSDVAAITGVSEIQEEDFWRSPIFYIELKTELATENETRIHKDYESERELLKAQGSDVDVSITPAINGIKQELLDWDAHIETPPPTLRSGTFKAKFKYIGRSKPIPIEDPWA